MMTDENRIKSRRQTGDRPPRRRGCALRRGAVLSLVVSAWLCIALCGRLPAAPASPSECQVEAAMIYNMARFVEWPEGSLPAGNDTFTICVLGKGELAAAVGALQGKTIKGRPVAVRQLSPTGEREACQILVIDRSERRRLQALLKQLNHAGVLTVSDAPRFASAGGSIGFVLLDGRVGFEINLEAVRQGRIKISSQLLKLARIVGDGE